MELDELMDFMRKEDVRLTEYFGIKDKEKMMLARTVKLMEEVGEFCEQILSSIHIQRKHKIERYSKDALSEEFADVIITTLLLAVSFDIEVKKSIDNKIEKIKSRI